MSGQELAREIQARCPRIRVLYSSGFVPGMRLGERALPPDMPFLQKPYTSAALARKVREVLG
jgi:hypothetical protein